MYPPYIASENAKARQNELLRAAEQYRQAKKFSQPRTFSWPKLSNLLAGRKSAKQTAVVSQFRS
jgi:hypothetical protein